MRSARRIAELLLIPTIAVAIALAVAPQRAALEVHIWLLVVFGLATVACLGTVRATYPSTPSPFEASLQHHAAAIERPTPLARLEREVSMAGGTAFDVHFRLRPELVELAGELLSSRRGIDLEHDGERAHAVLGEDAWELVRPDRPPPSRRDGPGISAAELERIVVALERA